MKRVLIAEDDPDTAEVIKETLEELLSVESTTINNGALVLDQLTGAPPDLLILDVNLPGLNGVDVFDVLRANSTLAAIPVLFLTGSPDRARRAVAGDGIREVMRKPFDAHELAAKVADLMARSETVA